MDDLTFEKLPGAISLLLKKMDRLESLLLNTTSNFQPNNQPPEDILDIRQASELIKYRPQTIRKMIMTGEIPSFRKNGRRLFRRSQLLLWLENGGTEK